MCSVRQIDCNRTDKVDFTPEELYLVTLTTDEAATICKAALHWNVDKVKALELTINGGMLILREVLPAPGCSHPPDFA